MSNQGRYRDYRFVDATVGARLLLGFVVDDEALRLRVPPPLELHPAAPASYAASLGAEALKVTSGPNLVLVFNDLLLNQDAQGRTEEDARARYVGFNIPARNTSTQEQGMVHFRIFTDNHRAVPGRYRDALPARVEREYRVIGEADSTMVHDHWELEPERGGRIELDLTYRRGPLRRIVGQEPEFLVWAQADKRIRRVYQEDTLFEMIRMASIGLDNVQQLRFRNDVPELADLFSGKEKLVSIFGNPHYSRRTFSPPPSDL
jgi:hypothetical protein